MRRSTQLTGLTACLCLLIVQWSGLHRHADETGKIGAPEIAASHTHFHEHGHDHENEHEHEDEREVSVLDLLLGSSKLPVGIVAHVAPLALATAADAPLRTDAIDPVPIGRHIRWRPPLRAPPRTV